MKEQFPHHPEHEPESERESEERETEDSRERERMAVMIEELERKNDRLIQEVRERDLEIQYLKRTLEEQKKIATKDAATGANNRRGVIELFQKIIPALTEEEGERRAGEPKRRPISALLLDIDNFKSINDRYGHNVGDTVLKRFAQFLENEIGLRKSDIVGRWGGEEFVIVFTADAQDIINKFYEREEGRAKVGKLREISFPSGIAGHEFTITLSGGIADWAPGESLEATVSRADEALYEAKRTGKDRILNYGEIKKKE